MAKAGVIVIVAAGCVSTALCSGAIARSAPQCGVDGRGAIKRQGDLPPALRAAIPFAMADPGQPFQVTDVVQAGEKLPWYRLICAYPTKEGYTIEHERGGRGYSIGRTRFRHVDGAYVAQ